MQVLPYDQPLCLMFQTPWAFKFMSIPTDLPKSATAVAKASTNSAVVFFKPKNFAMSA